VTGRTARGEGAKLVKDFGLQLGVLLAFFGLWQVATLVMDSPFFPSPVEIFGRVRELFLSGPASALFLGDAVFEDVLPSLRRLTLGWVLAVFIGVSLGYALARVEMVRDFVDPLMQFARAIPPPALIPIFIILLGIGDNMKIGLIAFSVVWPILLNTVDGVSSVEKLQLDTARVYGIGRRDLLFRVVLPSAGPKIFAGLRVSLSLAVILMVISEMIGATNGIGFQVVSAQRTFRVVDMWAGIVLLGVLGFVLNTALVRVESRTLRWHRGVTGTGA